MSKKQKAIEDYFITNFKLGRQAMMKAFGMGMRRGGAVRRFSKYSKKYKGMGE